MDTFYSLLDQYGLWAIALGSFFQSFVFVILAGILAADGILNISVVIVVAAVSSWVGHCFFYLLGYWLSKQHHLLSRSRIKTLIGTLENAIIHHPWESTFITQYGYGIRLVSATAFGFFKTNWFWFAWAQFINCTLWALLLSFIGFFTSRGFFSLPYPTRLPFGITLVSLLLLFFLFRTSRRQNTSSSDPSSRFHPEEQGKVE